MECCRVVPVWRQQKGQQRLPPRLGSGNGGGLRKPIVGSPGLMRSLSCLASKAAGRGPFKAAALAIGIEKQ